jgi:DNA-binding NarL/FixJ family response regulator
MKVVIVDAHAVLREGLEVLLERSGITTVGTSGTAAGALQVLREVQPDVALIALKLPDGSGVRLVRRLHSEHPRLAILIYTGVVDVRTLANALDSGARGVVLRVGRIERLVRALRLVATGKRYIDPGITALLDADAGGTPPILTKREREIFDLLADGLTSDEVAARLTLSTSTVRTHIRNAMEKLHSHTRTGAVVRALMAREIGS